ncbi:hypothetical protein CTI12_AA130900 [Artemisia annua]|uniref:Ubiquitin-like domain-containing protein n=1 Tax=Artemisia annua TaxID=35608 RepID=A0A2U1PFG8_ARTAN|nr:hypothetical protein CTI12_AA130900 [Artemisia annua]
MFSVSLDTAVPKVALFKDLLAEISFIPANKQKLFYRGIPLDDDQTIDTYGLQDGHTIHLEVVLNPPVAGTKTTPPSNTTTGMADMSQLIPAISMMMQRLLLSNPQYMKQIIDQNPQLQSMFDSNPQFREMMQNPEVVRRLTSPQMMQQMISSPILPELNQRSPLGILQPGATAVPPEQLYATQLSQLQETRLFDT